MIISKSPYTNIEFRKFEPYSEALVEQRIEDCYQAHLELWSSSLKERKEWMLEVSDILLGEKNELAQLITREMGKLITESVAEIEKCAWLCRYYAEYSESFLADEEVETDASKSYVSYRPLGVVLAVMPWNFPFWQVFRFAVPALMVGNAGLLKHASNVPQCAKVIERIFQEAGFPKFSLTNLLVSSDQVSAVISNPIVKAVTLTGSGPAGRAVAAKAAEHLKKSVLELGGSDPYLVLEDADVTLAAETCAKAKMLNAGQSCIGAKRFIAVREVYDEFLSAFRGHLEGYHFGDPMDPATSLAPLSSYEARDELHEQVLMSVAQGAHLLTGGYLPVEIDGAFYPPTILTEVDSSNLAYREELFGPVAVIFRVENTAEAVAVANDTSFGLGACIFTQNVIEGERIARDELKAGSCFVNAQVKSDPRLPFGGINESGFGRELARHGLLEFTNIKTIYIK